MSINALHLASSRLAAFARAAPRVFVKDVLIAGEWLHPVTGEPITFTIERLEALARATNRWIELGYKVWFPARHTDDPRDNLGYWSGFRVEGDRLIADVEVRDQEAAEQIGETITDVSVGIRFDIIAPDGELFDEVIEHVAATPAPVIPGQHNFNEARSGALFAREVSTMGRTRKKAAKRGGVKLAKGPQRLQAEDDDEDEDEDPAAEPAAAPDEDLAEESPSEDDDPADTPEDEAGEAMQIDPAAAIRAALGLTDDADAGAVIDAVRKLFAPVDEPEAEAEPEAEPEAVAALSRQVRGLRRELAAERHTRAIDAVEAVRELTAKAGIPLDADTSGLILSLWDGGNEAAARKMLDLSTAHATKLIEQRQNSIPLETPGDRAQSRMERESDRDHNHAYEAMLRGVGYSFDTDEATGQQRPIPRHARNKARGEDTASN